MIRMRDAHKAQAGLQELWNTNRDSKATIQRLRVEGIKNYPRLFWCAIFEMSETGRGFIVLGGNPEEARRSILHNLNLGRGTYSESTGG